MNKDDMQKMLNGLKQYVSGTYEDTEDYALIRIDKQGKISGSYYGPNSGKATYIEGMLGPKLLEAAVDLKQDAYWSKFNKIEGSGAED